MDCRIISVLHLVLAFTKAASSPGRLVCPVNSQKLLTDDRTLLPLNSISSSSEDSGNPTRNFINSYKWCSAQDTVDVTEQYMRLNFTEPVVITMLVSGGLASSYVMNFSIHHTLSVTENDFQPYGELKPVQDFSVPGITFSDVYFTLESPILAKRFEFRISEGRTDPFMRVCWSLLIHGCKQSEAGRIGELVQPLETTPTPTTSDTNPTTILTTVSSISEQPILPSSKQSLLQRDLLLIVLPSAVVLIVIFLIIVTVGVLICFCCMRSPQLDSPTYESVKIQLGNDRTRAIVDGMTKSASSNFLYDQPRPQFYDIPKNSLPGRGSNRGSSSTLGSHMEITNPIYLGQKNLLELANALHQLPPDDRNDYEDVLDTPLPMTAQERQCQSKATHNGGVIQSPDIPNEPKIPNLGGANAVRRTPSVGDKTKYSKVNKSTKEIDHEEVRGRSSSPVIKSHYMSTNVAITEELNRLTNELENSLKEKC